LPPCSNSGFGDAQVKKHKEYFPLNVRFEVVPQLDVPLEMTGLSINNDPGHHASQLTLTIKSSAASRLRSVSLLITFFNDRNEPLGGEIVRESFDANPNHRHHLQIPLSHYVDSGQRVALAFTSFQTETQSWAGDHEPIIQAMKQAR
jgi:hypothetical protein